MGRSRILVVDDDAWILRMVTTVLDRSGYEIVTATDGEQALAEVVHMVPDLIILDVMMPKLDGWSLIKRLRAEPRFALVPVIFLSALASDEDRIRGFRLGADDYLVKPFRFEELEHRVSAALKKRTQSDTTLGAVHASRPARPPAKDTPGVRGTLDQLGVSSLLSVLELERKSGVLVLMNGEETGRVFLRDGRVVRARFDHREEPANQDAVYRLLTWNDGRFEFSSLEVDMDDEVNTPTTQLLMEGARRIDEAGPRGDF